MKDSKKDVILWLIVLSFCAVLCTGLLGVTFDSILTDIRNLKTNDVYWLRNQVATLQEEVYLLRVGQDLILRDLGHLYELHCVQNDWLMDVHIILRGTLREIKENTTPMTWEELDKIIEEEFSEDDECEGGVCPPPEEDYIGLDTNFLIDDELNFFAEMYE